jgi:NAD(P)-dependent dehydrogenase (short-subunit alcohol dehydrogenase family)
VRVQAAALAWNLRGARINTVSPGVIDRDVEGGGRVAAGGHMMEMLDDCGAGRTGTPGEIADAVAFLTGPEASVHHRHRPARRRRTGRLGPPAHAA